MRFKSNYDLPLGNLTLASDGEALTGLWFADQKYFGAGQLDDAEEAELPVFAETRRWLDEYFAGRVPERLPALRLDGTAFQKAVWALLLEIPYGETVTYGALSARLTEQGIPASAQAVGGAVGRNPISILVPCHRVVGTGMKLTGYAGGLDRKRWLLTHEGVLRSEPSRPWYVYLLECSDGTLYTGCTPDLDRRISAHNAGRGAKYTRARRPVLLVYHEALPNRSAALRREAEIKSLTRAEKRLLINQNNGGNTNAYCTAN